MYEYIVFYFKFRVLDFNIQIFLQVFCEFVGGGELKLWKSVDYDGLICEG